jgi:hypothetical protein
MDRLKALEIFQAVAGKGSPLSPCNAERRGLSAKFSFHSRGMRAQRYSGAGAACGLMQQPCDLHHVWRHTSI